MPPLKFSALSRTGTWKLEIIDAPDWVKQILACPKSVEGFHQMDISIAMARSLLKLNFS